MSLCLCLGYYAEFYAKYFYSECRYIYTDIIRIFSNQNVNMQNAILHNAIILSVIVLRNGKLTGGMLSVIMLSVNVL
jgi:hypothetical protein